MSSKRASIATFLAQTRQNKLTIELNKSVMDPVQVVEYMRNLPGEQILSQSFVKMFHKGEHGSSDVKMKVFDSNLTTMFNQQDKHFQLDNSTKLLIQKTTEIKSVPQTADKIVLVRRFVRTTNHDNWAMNIELVKELNNPLEFKTKLGVCKKLLVDTSMREMTIDAYDYISISIEQLEIQQLTHANVIEIINEFQSTENDSSEYQDKIYSLAKDIFARDPVMVAQFKRQSGFKRLCSNTIELSRPIYFKQILPNIASFYITDKMDGTRAMLVIEEVYRRSGHRRIYLGTDIYAVSDVVYQIASFSKPTGSKVFETDRTVLDVEMLSSSNEYKFYCFDVICIKSKKMSGFPFKDRFLKFDEANELLQKYDLGEVKTFVKLTSEDYADQINKLYSEKRKYHIDGIIFTPEGQDYKTAVKSKKNKFDRIFNTDYSNTISFKWKPLDQLTIDFYLMKHPSKKKTYILCSGVDIKTFELLKLEFFDGYKAPQSPNAYKYFPIQFQPYDGKFNYEWETDNENDLNGMVGEFSFAEGDQLLPKPKLIRLRTDRVQDVAKGEYYGNALKYAELIWHSIQYPLTIKNMGSPESVGYFADDNNDWYKAQRSFNSFVKTYLMEMYLYSPVDGKANIIDIAAGKGQDLARAIDIGFDEILLLDKDTDAIYELLERKYNLRIKRKNATANVHVKQIDLEKSSEDNIQTLKLPENKFQSCMINFAIHYISHSAKPDQKDPITEFVKFVHYNLKSGGRILITAFNGEDVFKLLQDKDEWELRENNRVKYSIKREFTSKEFTKMDQSIGVMLPFSNNQYYSEYLVNFDYLQTVFEEHGFKLIKSDGFASLMRAYKKQNPKGHEHMTEQDKEYVGLYGYLIFEKE